MNVDISEALRTAIANTDPAWVDHPSHVRRRLVEALGAEARPRRAEIHQLVVAAEERIPVRLRRDGWSPNRFAELTEVLVATRGWTVEAAAWAVTTWAIALGHAVEPLPMPSGSARTPTVNAPPTPDNPSGAVVSASPEPTVLPSDGHPVGVQSDRRTTSARFTDATAQPTVGSSSASQNAGKRFSDAISSGSSSQGVGDRASATPPVGAPSASGTVAEWPRRGTARPTRSAARWLGHDVDVAYEAKTGASPLLLLLATPIGLAAFAFPLLSGVLLLVFTLTMAVGSKRWPTRLVAVRGDEVWVLRKIGKGSDPATAIVAHTTLEHVRSRTAFLLRSVEISGVPLWFQFPQGRAAVALIAAASSSKART